MPAFRPYTWFGDGLVSFKIIPAIGRGTLAATNDVAGSSVASDMRIPTGRPINAQTLIVLSRRRGFPSRQEMAALERNDQHPRVLLFEDTLAGDILDQTHIEAVTGRWRYLYRLLPHYLSQAIEAARLARHYGAVVTWDERLCLAYGLIRIALRIKEPHVALMYWISPPKKSRVLRLAYHGMDRIVTWSVAQRDFAINVLGIPAEAVVHVPYQVDTRFWRPLSRSADVVSAVGNEMRDYPTLLSAARMLPYQFRLVVGGSGRIPAVTAISRWGHLPPNVTAGPMGFLELREVYAHSHAVVVPLLESDTNHGLTVILEAMAMGKPVICSRVRGHIDIIRDGETGILVPPGDPVALADAIRWLYERPEEASRIGARARQYVEQEHSFEAFCNRVREVVDEVVAKPSIT